MDMHYKFEKGRGAWIETDKQRLETIRNITDANITVIELNNKSNSIETDKRRFMDKGMMLSIETDKRRIVQGSDNMTLLPDVQESRNEIHDTR